MDSVSRKFSFLKLKITGLIMAFFLVSWSLIANRDGKKIKNFVSTDNSGDTDIKSAKNPPADPGSITDVQTDAESTVTDNPKESRSKAQEINSVPKEQASLQSNLVVAVRVPADSAIITSRRTDPEQPDTTTTTT
jgi:hypothetical protein